MNHNAATKTADASAIIGYQFTNPAWLWEALQAAGSPVLAVPQSRIREGNNRLAGLGDRILSMIIVKRALVSTDGISGDTNGRIQAYASNERLARLCDSLGLTVCINGNPSQQGMRSARVKAATIEAVIAAVFQDAGLEAAEEVIDNIDVIIV
ncbi:RNase [Colletotrichum musicola]|uniref:RNase n=1 Tax=Colletotrichum musicola TaxID=2175873 RepID=A0A8H6K337_9PEZI|nr:RNase [Colletotrichum musicola]